MCAQSIPPTHRQPRRRHTESDPLSTNQTPANKQTLRRAVTDRRRPAYLRWWPALSFFPFGLLLLAWMAITAGVRLRLSTGMTNVRVRERVQEGRGERTNTHHQALNQAGTGHWASFACTVRLSTRVTSVTFHLIYNQKCGSRAVLEAEGYLPFLELMFPPRPLSRSR